MAAVDDDKRDEPWQALSAMADGEADATEEARCLAQWSTRTEVRARWHAYHVIGDALRSDELAAHAADDAAFLGAWRDRLAREATVAVELPRGRVVERALPRWFGGVAVAAGVGAVALTLTMIGPADTELRGQPSLARAPENTIPVTRSAVAEPPVSTANGQLIRDARLDRYLAAHRQGAIGASLQMPGAIVRSVDNTIVLEQR